MAKYSNRTDIGIKKQKPFTGNTKKLMDFTNEYILPKTPADVAMYLIPYGKIAKGAYKGAKKITTKTVKKVVKPASKVKKVTASKKIK
jgi:hypothetical protein